MGNSPTRHDSSAGSFRENSKQYREYRALENKIRLLKIQANNYNGVGKDALYTDMFAAVQDTIETVRYLREKAKSSNRKIEYDMLEAELKSCLQILSSKIHPSKAPQEQQKTSGGNEQLQYALDSLEARIKQLKNSFANNQGNQNILNQYESNARGLFKELDNLVAPNNQKKLYLRELLQDVLNDCGSKQAELYRKSKYDNLEVSSEPTDPNLQILLKMEKSLSVFRDREYLTSEGRDVAKMIDTLNCYKNDLHNLRITSKDVNKKHVELLGFVDSTIKFLTDIDNKQQQRRKNDTVDKPHPLMKTIQEEIDKLQTSANQNSTNETHLKRIIDLLQQVNYSLQHRNSEKPHHKSSEVISNRISELDPNEQYRGSTDDMRKAAAKTTLQIALERKGYRKTFLANTMIKQHAAKFKRHSNSSEVPDPDYAIIDDPQEGDGGHRNSFNSNDKFVRPTSPVHSDVGNGGSQYNSLPKSTGSEYRGSPSYQLTPNSSRRHDNRSNSKARQEIDSIRRDLDHLRNKVDKFSDSRQSAQYEDLETLLLELLVRLEQVQSDAGAVEATDALVHTIRDTQKVLYILDEKALKYKTPNNYAY